MRAGRGEMQETVLFGFTPWRHASRTGERTIRRRASWKSPVAATGPVQRFSYRLTARGIVFSIHSAIASAISAMISESLRPVRAGT